MGQSSAPAPINQLYLDRLRLYERRAKRWKQLHLFLGLIASFLTWITLLLAIWGMAVQLPEEWNRFLLFGIVPSFGGVVIVATVFQTFFGVQGRWLNYRAGAEHLREACMLLWAKLPPFDGSDAEQALKERMDEIHELATKGTGKQFVHRSAWRYFWPALKLPEDLRLTFPDLTDTGPFPRLSDKPVAEGLTVLDQRLQHQRRWHLRKARAFLLRYLGFQALVLLISLANFLYIYFIGREFWLIAVTTTVNLMLFALRDFLGYGSLFQRYVKIAGNLEEIRDAYTNGDAPFDKGNATERCRTLVKSIEETLSIEFHFWYASRH